MTKVCIALYISHRSGAMQGHCVGRTETEKPVTRLQYPVYAVHSASSAELICCSAVTRLTSDARESAALVIGISEDTNTPSP